MDLFDFFWNIRQQHQIGAVTTKASIVAGDARAHEGAIADLSHRLERLSLVTQALFELLSERAHVSEADLVAKITEIDTRDGKRDGRASVATRTCPKCGHPTASSRATCLYCGASLGSGKPFDGL